MIKLLGKLCARTGFPAPICPAPTSVPPGLRGNTPSFPRDQPPSDLLLTRSLASAAWPPSHHDTIHGLPASGTTQKKRRKDTRARLAAAQHPVNLPKLSRCLQVLANCPANLSPLMLGCVFPAEVTGPHHEGCPQTRSCTKAPSSCFFCFIPIGCPSHAPGLEQEP